jgi:endo-1,4-beta-xylanase
MNKVKFAVNVRTLIAGVTLCGLSLAGCEVQNDVQKQSPQAVSKRNARSTYPGTGLVPAGATKFLGNILTGNPGESAADYDLFKSYWNHVAPENAGKHGQVEGTRDVYDWSRMDKIYDFATTNNIGVTYHTFIFNYGINLPTWLEPLSDADTRAEMEEFIRDYFERYPATENAMVVNEAFQNTPPEWFRTALGNGNSDNVQWIRWMFQKARQYAPAGCKLYINEAGVLKSQSRTEGLRDLCNTLKLDGNIDGIGLQEHELESTSAANVSARLNIVATTGLDLYISEYDVNKGVDTDQLNIMSAQFPVFWEHPQVKGVTLWGYRQGKTWKPNTHLIRTDGTERPALVWLRNYLQGGGGAADDIVSITAPGSVTRSTNATVSVNYKASTNRLIQVVLQQDTSPYTIYGSVNTNVSAGTGTLNVTLPISNTVPLGTDAAKIVVILAPTGGGWPNKLDYQEKLDVDVTAAAPTTDDIVSITAPGSVARGTNATVSVNYKASTNRLIQVVLQQDTSPYTIYGSVNTNVSAGTGTLNVTLPISNTVPLGTDAAKIVVILAPTGGGWPNKLDYQEKLDVDVTAAAPTTDALTSVSGPVTISRGSTVAVNIGYTASTSRRITLQLQKDTSPFTNYKTVTKDVAAGSGTTTLNLAVPSTVPVGSAAYKYFVIISPLGGGYNNRLDEAQQADVTVQ